MKLIFTFLILLNSLNIAQKIIVQKTEKLILSGGEQFFYPTVSPKGDKIALSKSNLKGLWIYDLESQSVTRISSFPGSGINPEFTSDGKEIFFRVDEYISKSKTTSVISYNFNSGNENLHIQDLSDKYFPKVLLRDSLLFKLHKTISDKIVFVPNTIVYSEDSKIIVFKNNFRSEIQPLGNGNYIWASLSPDNKTIVFTLVGEGTFISDLDGNILYKIGYANAPKFSPDGKWLLYMVDKDDGIKYISSEICISSVDGKQKYQITNTENVIEQFPSWFPDGNKIIYHDLKGQIYICNLLVK